MSIFMRGNVWWYEFVFCGQRIRESTGSGSQTLAVKAERNRRRELEESFNGVRPKRRPILFPPAAREWMSVNQARWSEAYVAIQDYNLKHLSAYFGKMALSDITAPDIGKYQGKRSGQGASNRTVNMEVGTLRMILKKARLWANLEPDVKMLTERKDIGRALAQDEETRLLAACKASPSRSLYTAVIVLGMTGLRGAELRCARWHQVDFLGKKIQVGKSKTPGGEGREVPLHQAALTALQEWRAQWPSAKPNEYIFPSEKLVFKGKGAATRGIMTPYAVDLRKPTGSWKRAWGTAKKEAGVECRMHDLRHSFVSKLAENQTPDATIQELAGWMSKKMQERYSHVRAEAKRRAVDLLGSIQPPTVQ